MVVAVLELMVTLPARSLKEKRALLRGTLERARRDLGVSISEVGDQDLWGNALIGVAFVSDNSTHAMSMVRKVEQRFDANPQLEVVQSRFEAIRV